MAHHSRSHGGSLYGIQGKGLGLWDSQFDGLELHKRVVACSSHESLTTDKSRQLSCPDLKKCSIPET